MELPPLTDDSLASFEWSELFDFTIDDQLFVSHNNPDPPPPPPQQEAAPVRPETSDRVRKRDPRLVCENFLAGRVPCACPELDEKMEEEGGPGKKRLRMARTPGLSRCQVPGCEADISELKGYHRRHRVCLRCANAVSVVLDGESKRYCQQCGKFHVLSDFDEGKRSCRRKLERHNNRRRRKPVDSSGAVDKEPQGDLHIEDVSSDGEAGKENAWSGSQIAEREDSKDGTLSNLCLAMESQNIENSVMTCAKGDKVTDHSNRDHSPPSYDNKSAYSSVCPTGRISFKLYDWNPAEFPRRLRHQIFQWLASMPIELEGYIRPGCTILTAFVSMPQFMWMKLFEDPISYVQSSVGPGGMLSGKGMALVYLNNMSFRVLKDGASIMKINVAMRTPKLHYVYPPCFEAGKPMDFIACGSNLLQPKFRSIISFAGKYLPHDYYVAFPRGDDEDASSADFGHQFCRIYVPHTEPTTFGPAFIEVENESGLSNFIPVLIGDEHVCSEIKMIHQKYCCSHCKKKSQLIPVGPLHGTCEVSCARQTSFSEFMLDISWLLKSPLSEELRQFMTSSQIQRLCCVLNFLISNKSTSILERILLSQQVVLDEMESSDVASGVKESDKRLLKRYIGHARDYLRQSVRKDELTLSHVGSSVAKSNGSLQNVIDNGMPCSDHTSHQDKGTQANTKPTSVDSPDSQEKGETVSLLNGEISMTVPGSRQRPTKSCNIMLSKQLINSRPSIYMIVAVAVCLGVCAVVFHPHKVSKLAVTIRRCLFDNSL